MLYLFDPNAKKSQICSGSHVQGLFYVHGIDFAWPIRLAALQRSLWGEGGREGGECFRFRCFQEHFYSTSKQQKVQSCLILHPINMDNQNYLTNVFVPYMKTVTTKSAVNTQMRRTFVHFACATSSYRHISHLQTNISLLTIKQHHQRESECKLLVARKCLSLNLLHVEEKTEQDFQ